MSEDAPRRRRRAPGEARREIMDAAERLLVDRPLRELGVDEIMAATTLRRPSFYVSFEDRGALMLALLDRVTGQMMEASTPWFDLSEDATRAEAVAALEEGLVRVTEVFAEHGPLVVAVAEAAVMDARVEEVYRGRVLGALVDAVATRLEAEVRAGRSEISRPRETAEALVLLNESFSARALGRPPTRPVAKVVEVLSAIWTRTLYSSR